MAMRPDQNDALSAALSEEGRRGVAQPLMNKTSTSHTSAQPARQHHAAFKPVADQIAAIGAAAGLPVVMV
jgi:hypothetical protein